MKILPCGVKYLPKSDDIYGEESFLQIRRVGTSYSNLTHTIARRASTVLSSRAARWGALAASTSSCVSASHVASEVAVLAVGFGGFYLATRVIDRLFGVGRTALPAMNGFGVKEEDDLTGMPVHDQIRIGDTTMNLREAAQHAAAGQVTPAERGEIRRRSLIHVAKQDAAELLQKVRQSRRLRFTRNIALAELADMVTTSKLRPNPDGRQYKDYRYGLSHEYGLPGFSVTVMMKDDFMEQEVRDNENDIKGRFVEMMHGKSRDEMVEAMTRLHKEVQYNHQIEVREPHEHAAAPGPGYMGHSIAFQSDKQFMGYYPQLRVYQPVSIDRVDRILVPEHLWDRVVQMTESNGALRSKLVRVEGTGKTKDEFLAGRENLRRRTRGYGGSFEPNFGSHSYHRFEIEYFRIVVGEGEQPVEAYREETHEKCVNAAVARAAGEAYDTHTDRGWIWVSPQEKVRLLRGQHDWKIFVNPNRENFYRVLEIVVSVLSRYPSGIMFKVPDDLDRMWRAGRIFGDSSSTPKIVIYLNPNALPAVALELDHFLRNQLSAGFPGKPGPSFARPFGDSGLVYYKKEYADDRRVEVAEQAAWQARDARVPGQEIRARQEEALRAAGWTGENFYMKAGDVDPLDDEPTTVDS